MALEQLTSEELDKREQGLLASLIPIDPNVSRLGPAGLDIRERELVDSLRRDGIDVNEPVLELTPEESFQREQDIISLSQKHPFLTFHDLMNKTLPLKSNQIGFVETLKKANKLELLPFVGSLYKTERLLQVLDSVNRLNLPKGTMTDDLSRPIFLGFESVRGQVRYSQVSVDEFREKDMELVSNWIIKLNEEQERGFSISGRIAQGIAELPAFMVEFLLTGPLFRIGNKAAQTAATKVLGRFAEKGVGKLAVKVAGAGFGTLLRTSINMPRVLAGAVENMTEGIQVTDDGAIAFADTGSPFSALARSFADLYIENLTEVAGPSLKKGAVAIGKGIGKKFPVIPKFTQAIADRWISNGAAKGLTRTFGGFLKASATKVGYDGILEEMGEEQLGRVIRGVTGLEEFSTIIPKWEDILVEAGIFSIPGVTISLAQTKIFRKDVDFEPVEKRLGLVGEEFEKAPEAPPIALKLAISPAAEGIVPKLENQGKIGVFDEGQFIPEPQVELNKIVANVKKNEGEQAAKITKLLLDKGIQTESTHVTEDEIIVGVSNLSAENRVILKEAGLVIEKMPPLSGEFIHFAKEAQPPTKTAEETKVVKTTADTKTNAIKANVKEASVEATGTVDAIRRNILRAEDAVGFWGTAGKKVQRDLREISARTARNVGNTSQNIRIILKGTTSAEKTIISQLTDGVISEKGQPARLVARARALKKQLDIMQNQAIGVGLRKAKLTGRAFPQVPNKKGKDFLEEAELKGAKSRRVFAWAQNQVTKHKETKGKKGFKTVDAAIASLQKYRRTRLRGTEGYFEGARTLELDLDMREWSPDKILPGIVEGGWENIEAARQWGITKDGNFKAIRTSIERIRSEVGVDQANLLEDYIKAQYGQSRASTAARKWTKKARAIQFVGKLALSPLTITRNMLDRYAKGLSHGTVGTNIRATLKFPPFLNLWLNTSRKLQDEMIRRGAVLGHGHLSEGFASGGAISKFVGQAFAQSERGNQTYIALVKKIQLEADLKRLHEMGGETGTIGKMYDRMLAIVGQSQLQTRKRVLTDLTNEQLADAMTKEKISDDVLSEVLHRVVTDSAFPLTLASKRMWWGNRPFVQTMTQFKIWSADQMRFIYKDVLKYTIATGDPSRLTRFILGTWLAGELYNIARDFLTDKDESLASTLQDEDGRNPKEIAKSIANALVDGGATGMLADLTYGITDWAFGPTVGSIESIARVAVAVKNDPATTVDGLKKFILEDIPAAKQAQGVLDRIDRTFFEKEENLTANYAKWRKRSFDFRKKKGELTTIERTTGRVVLGRPARLPGPRTLSLEMIARQVLVGDADDAADFIVGIFKDTKPEKLKDLRASFRQSAINNSPLGNIAKKDIPEFLNQFSKEGQNEIIALQKQWAKNYNEAFVLAGRQLKEDRFFEDLKRELE